MAKTKAPPKPEGASGVMSGLGRLVIVDPRDKLFPAQAATRRRPRLTGESSHFRYWWNKGWNGNQGNTPKCVAYAWTHLIENGPITHDDRTPGADPIVDTDQLYADAQKIDEWPGENYDGTSVRAGAKVLQSLGLIREYRWAFNMPTLIDAVLRLGPVVMGTYWTRGMWEPDDKGFIHATGPIDGGHAYVIDGLNVREAKARILNSWGTGWGDNGRAWISFTDLSLLLDNYGECCVPVELRTS